ncbi:hypothetical protein ACMG4P_04870 [Pseudovibrio denitrificans]|uniref:hypothetical protein n=1 Tax=Pseudovibrio denitrificans TaxID=258256 RepID=UPI0039BFFB81
MRYWNALKIVVACTVCGVVGGVLAIAGIDYLRLETNVCLGISSTDLWACRREWIAALSGWFAGVTAIGAAIYAGRYVKRQIDRTDTQIEEAQKTNSIALQPFLAESFVWHTKERDTVNEYLRTSSFPNVLRGALHNFQSHFEQLLAIEDNNRWGDRNRELSSFCKECLQQLMARRNNFSASSHYYEAGRFISPNTLKLRSEFISLTTYEANEYKSTIQSVFVLLETNQHLLEPDRRRHDHTKAQELAKALDIIIKSDSYEALETKRLKSLDAYSRELGNEFDIVNMKTIEIRDMARPSEPAPA